MKFKNIFKITILLLFFSSKMVIFSQEWQYQLEWGDLSNVEYSIGDVQELSSRNLISTATLCTKESMEDNYSISPAVFSFSKDGELLYSNEFFIPGYCTLSYPYLFEKNNAIYMLSTYSPEHTRNCSNHFMNQDLPPSDGKLVLTKMDYQLNVEERYEHSWPIDTHEAHGTEWEFHPNGFSGNIYLFSAIEDDDNIVGLYWKCESFHSPTGGLDTLFIFKMNFNGEILLKKDIEIYDSSKGNHRDFSDTRAAGQPYKFRRNHLVATDSCYIFYQGVDEVAEFYNKEDFSHIKNRRLFQPNLPSQKFRNENVRRSNHNTTYLTTQIRSRTNPHHDEDIRLYEFSDNDDADGTILEVINYVERSTEEWDCGAFHSGIDVIDDKSIYHAYALNRGYFSNLDSWIVIERLDNNLDTVITRYYGVGDRRLDELVSVTATSDKDVILVHRSDDLDSESDLELITRISSTAFGFEPDNIEEAHANNLHLAVAYPNPGGDVLNIRTGLRNAKLQVYDMQGRIVYQQIITDEVTSVDASKWKSGTYIWKLTVNNEQLTVEEGKWVK